MVAGDIFRIWSEFDLVDAEEVEKAGKKAKTGLISGIASTEQEDADGEVVLQGGLDWDWFKSNGYFTYEHPMSVGNIVGEPSTISTTEIDGVAATTVDGLIYLSDPVGRTVYGKALAMKKAGGNRRLGFSIEGQVVERDGNTIKKAKVYSVAISPRPKNNLTWWEPLMRSVLGAAAGYSTPQGAPNFAGDFSPLMPQDLEGTASGRFSSATFKDQSLRGRFLKDLSFEDLEVTRVLKAMPGLSWTQGILVLSAFKRTKS
jgi:hypothetical protein